MTRPRCLTLLGLLALACNTPAATPGATPAAAATAAEAAPAPAPDAPAPGDAAVIAELREVSGPAGVRTPDLPEGAFLGKGAKLRAGQRVIVPRGTLAEIVLDDGGTLRINEESALVLPAGKRSITLEGGELVALITSGQAPLDITAAGDTFTVKAGEARVLSQGGAQRYAVVYGAATVQSGGKSVDLGPGATLDTPIVESRPVEPVISLRPLEETAWARAFDVAAQMADAVPMGVGSLTARRAGESAERYSLRLVDHKVNVTISGRIALTEIEQTFYNEAPLVLEGTYRFPLPTDASISGLSLLVGNQWMEAAMLEKERARQIFKEIVDATVPRDPALLEWEHGNIFKLKIFPIPGRGERKIRLRYTQVLDAVGDNLRYRYPLSGASSGASGTAIDDFDLKIAIDRSELPADALAAIRTPMAELARQELGDRIELSSHQRAFRPVHDLGVDIPLPPADRRMHAETHLDRDGQAYFMLAVQPSLDLPPDPRPVHYAFVLDRSHSTTPELWTVARHLVQALGVALDADDRLTVLACDTVCDAVGGGLRPAAGDTLREIDTFLEGQVLAGASDLAGMTRAAAEALQATGGAGERVIVYLGDGNPSAGELAPDEILRHLDAPLRGVRFQAVAMGARSDETVLGALARKTGGDLVRADAKDDLRGLVRELRIRAKVPVAREVAIDLPDGMIYTHPADVAAIRPGDTLVLLGKLARPVDGPLTVRARGADGREVADTFQVKLAADRVDPSGRHAHLPRTWAREEIEALTTTQGHAAKPTIIELSKRYTVLSRYTALLALENDAMYREFNVVRNAGGTDKWEGDLKATTAGATVSRSQADVATETAPAAPPSAEPKEVQEEAEKSPRPRADRAKDAEREAPTDAWDKSGDAFDDDARASRGGSKRDASEDEVGGADFDDGLADPGAGKGSSGSAPASKPPASRPMSPPAEPAKAKKASSESWDDMPLGEVAGGAGGGYGYGGGPGYGRGRRYPTVGVSGDVTPSSRDQGRVDELRRQRDVNPSNRAAHRKLVQAAIYYGLPEAFDYARAWAEADPDHAPALLAVADLLAARGDAVALRAYGSAIEVKPFDRKLHARLADTLLGKGDMARACAHRRAIVSIDPASVSNHVDLVSCLARASRMDLARDAVTDGLARAKGNLRPLQNVAADLDRGLIPVTDASPLHSYADLRATLTWNGEGDLDIALVDRRGRRLSAMRRESVLVREGRGEETLTFQTIDKPVYIEVTRVDPSGPPVRATLKVKTPHTTKTFEITSGHETLRLAKVSWNY